MKTIKLILLALLMPVVALSQNVVVDGILYNIEMDYHLNKVTAHVGPTWTLGYDNYGTLVDVVIPETVEYQGTTYPVTEVVSAAFEAAPNLTSIELPNTLVYINTTAFSGCSKLESVNLPSSLVEIGEDAFFNCTSLTSVDIPASITEIQKSTFQNCSNLQTVTLHNGLTRIGKWAFQNCGKLTNIVFPESLREIGDNAFQYCPTLTDVEIPAGVTKMGVNPFSDCGAISRMAVTSGNSTYASPNDKCIVETGTKRLVSVNNDALIPSSIEIIGANAFGGRTDLESIVIPGSVTRIEDYAFDGCRNLRNVTVSGKLSSIGFSILNMTAWYNAQADNSLIYLDDVLIGYKGSLTEANIKNGTRLIPERCFEWCSAKSISFPSSVEAIGDYIFTEFGNYNIETMYFGGKEPVNVNDKAFYCGYDMRVYVPQGYSGAYTGTPWSNFYRGIFEYGNEEITIGSNGIRTFCSENSLDFANSDVRAYVVSEYDTSTSEVTLRRVYDVPGMTGVLLVGDPGSYQVPSYPRPSDGTNLLVGVKESTTLYKEDGSFTNYILAAKEELGFYPVKDGTTLAGGKAYLRLPTGSGPSLARVRIAFEDETEATGIAVRVADKANGDDAIYNLNGQRLHELQKGLNIVNGKKVIIK